MMQFVSIIVALFFAVSVADAETYSLEIAHKDVTITGNRVEKITVNGSIPGPTLYFTEGEEAVIHVTNHMDEDTSVHWHGLLLPGDMDGVPGLNGFPGIRPGETFTYRFKLRQSGTYWYHAHSLGQEQDGHYGALVIAPREQDSVQADRDYVVLLSDFSEETWDEILHNLKMHSDQYNYGKRTVGDFFSDIKEKGFQEAWRFVREWGEMRMSPTDLADVSGYTFLVNGKTPEDNWTGVFKAGEKVRLRFINASAMTFYDVRIPGLQMRVVQADGQDVEPVVVDEFRFGVAETYDVLVEPKEEKAYTIAAESIDRTGFALATLAPREGMRGDVPPHRRRTLLTMADMGMDHASHSGHVMAATKREKNSHAAHSGMNHAAMDHSMHHPQNNPAKQTDAGKQSQKADTITTPQSGWADADTPAGHTALNYKHLRALTPQRDVRKPEREIEVRLGGNMERYIWTLNGKRHQESGPMILHYGERVRLKYINDTMMAHPMHLHGMFVQIENGQPLEKLPNKHTVIIPPGQSYSVLLTADEPGAWAFHCHLLYHMLSGMMTTVIVPVPEASTPATMHGGHHAH